MRARLVEAGPEDHDALAQLLEFNAYEFSRFDGRRLGADGRFGYPYLSAYRGDADRYAYLVVVDAETAGFTLARQDGDRMSVAEFLIMPKFRRQGLGIEVARDLFARHPGLWRVGQVPGNTEATAFWRRAIPVPFEEQVAPDGSTTQTFTL